MHNNRLCHGALVVPQTSIIHVKRNTKMNWYLMLGGADSLHASYLCMYVSCSSG